MELVLALVVGLLVGAKYNTKVNGVASKIVTLVKSGLAKIKS